MPADDPTQHPSDTSEDLPSFDQERFYRLLATRDFGRPLLHYPSVTSTNDVARAAAEGGAPSGTVVVADQQTAGRGRLARVWFSPPGQGLWTTVLVRPGAGRPGLLTWLTPLAGVAAALTIRKRCGVPVMLKWPNDLMVGGRKLGGILAESRMEPGPTCRYAIIGLGLNVRQSAADFPAELAGRATSLAMEGAKNARTGGSGVGGHAAGDGVVDGGRDRADLLAAILNRLEEEYLALVNQGAEGLLCRYRMLCSTVGQTVTARLGERTLEGLATGIGPDGSLLLLPTGSAEEIAIPAGEVTIRPKSGRPSE